MFHRVTFLRTVVAAIVALIANAFQPAKLKGNNTAGDLDYQYFCGAATTAALFADVARKFGVREAGRRLMQLDIELDAAWNNVSETDPFPHGVFNRAFQKFTEGI